MPASIDVDEAHAFLEELRARYEGSYNPELATREIKDAVEERYGYPVDVVWAWGPAGIQLDVQILIPAAPVVASIAAAVVA